MSPTNNNNSPYNHVERDHDGRAADQHFADDYRINVEELDLEQPRESTPRRISALLRPRRRRGSGADTRGDSPGSATPAHTFVEIDLDDARPSPSSPTLRRLERSHGVKDIHTHEEVYRPVEAQEPKKTDQPEYEEDDSAATDYYTSDEDIEAQQPDPDSRFVYEPKSFWNRLLVSVHVKNKLDTSKVVRVAYSPAYRYTLLILLLLITAFLTPQLLPSWLGFELAKPDDLCENPDAKIREVEEYVRKETKIEEAQRFLVTQNFHLECMNVSARNFYNGAQASPPRFQWPAECNSEKAKTALSETRCEAREANVCKAVGGVVGFFMSIGGNCVRDVGPEKCVNVTDPKRAQELLELEDSRRRLRRKPEPVNVTEIEKSPLVRSTNKKVQELVSRLVTQVDIAADAFIIYSILSIAVGVPLVIYKREKGSRLVGATLGMTKIWFIVVFVIVLAVYDSGSVMFRETNFMKLLQNFFRDPCYVDPRFNARRIATIADTCSNLSYIKEQSEDVLQQMDDVYYKTRLFGFCKDAARQLAEHPRLAQLDDLRMLYRNGNLSMPSLCNATALIEDTSSPPMEKGFSWWGAVIGSGVLAQLALKFIVTSWVLHVFAYIEPLIVHNGKVEVWGTRGPALSVGEEEAVTRFARDKHLLSLLIFSTLMVLEVVLIIYSIASSVGDYTVPAVVLPKPIDPSEVINLRCPASIFPM